MTGDVVAALRAAGLAEVDDSDLARTLYATDASTYRIPPRVVVRPRHVDDLDAILAVSRETGVPLTMRGSGTSIAGNAIGPGIVVDTRAHLNRVLRVDPETRTAEVEPGVVHAALQRQAAAVGLRFGPDPSTHTRCTIGGMIGNNACGSRALGYGRTADNVVGLDALAGDGRPAAEHAAALGALVEGNLALVRTRFGTFSRQVSGYSLEHLLPERGRLVDRFLVGSEGTLAVVRRATVRLVQDAPVRGLAVLGYPSMVEAAAAVPAMLVHRPVACEGLDERIVNVVPQAPPLPAGAGWLFVEVTGQEPGEVADLLRRVVADGDALDHRIVLDPAEQAALWRVREDGAGLAARTTRPAGQAGWEDAAVPPAELASYLAGFEELLVAHGLHGAPYGHFGDGCVHVRIDFALREETGRQRYRQFVEDAARLTVAHGGSLSGEHGDGRARSELLAIMYGAEELALFGAVKAQLDPDGVLNPGVLVDPAPLDADLRLGQLSAGRSGRSGPGSVAMPLTLHRDAGDLVEAVHRCTGVGKCLADNRASGGVMCPSYLATGNEKDSTRGRARALQDAVAGHLAWDSPAVADALDLCLSCKGCSRDCPTGVDLATYKAVALHQRYAGRRRPLTHYSLGRLPAVLRRVPPGLVKSGLSLAPRIAARFAGVDTRRSLPAPASRPFHRDLPAPGEQTPDVAVWVDTFTDRFRPEVARAALEVLTAAGLKVRVVSSGDRCCGLTWLSTGQLDQARRYVTAALEELSGAVPPGVPVVVLEPSCLAALKVDSAELLTEVPEVTGRLHTLAEVLAQAVEAGWEPPSLAGAEVVAQPHCHQAAVLGWAADRDLLRRAGARVVEVPGCCGLAGNWGMEKGHYEASVAVFGTSLGPALDAAPDAVVLTDGFSCATQVDDLAGRPSRHLAEVLAEALSTASGGSPEGPVP